MKYFLEDIGLPKLPDELLIPYSEIKLLEREVDLTDTFETYIPSIKQFKCFNRLMSDHEAHGPDWNIRYQVVRRDLPIHTDRCDNDFKYLFLYDYGGDEVITEWYQDEEVVSSVNLKNHTWNKLSIQIPHRVRGILRPRLSFIYNTQKNYLTNQQLTALKKLQGNQ